MDSLAWQRSFSSAKEWAFQLILLNVIKTCSYKKDLVSHSVLPQKVKYKIFSYGKPEDLSLSL